MPSRPTGVTDAPPVAGTVTEVDMIERASPELKTTTTADPGSAGTSLALTAAFADASGFKVRVENEVMLVTAGGNTTTATVTRGVDGTTAVAHAIGTTVSRVVAVQRVEPVSASQQISYVGRASTFRIPGRAGTTGQKIFAIHNASGSPVLVDVEKITIDVMQTVAKVVEPPVIRLMRFTTLPTGGASCVKVPEDSSQTSNANVTIWQDASAENTNATTALTITPTTNAILDQTWAARALTLTGYEQFDNYVFLPDESAATTLRALEGLVVFLDYSVATANPTTDKWVAAVRWTEYTAA